MPRDMYGGATSGDFAKESANQARGELQVLTQRVAELEEALCGLCQMLQRRHVPYPLANTHPQLQKWFEQHKVKPGCELQPADEASQATTELEHVRNMNLDDAKAAISNSVYAATTLFEQLESAGKCRGNGHHARQSLAAAAAAELQSRWLDA